MSKVLGSAKSLTLGSLVLAVGCNAEIVEPATGTGGSTNAGGTATGGSATGGTAIIPTQDGVPIGDCREPTAEEQTALGCPVAEPEPMSACSAPDGTTCRYEIRIQSGRSSQVIFACMSPEWDWGPGVMWPCGQSCDSTLGNVVELSGESCSLRPLVSCQAGSEVIYAYPPSAQMLLDAAFRRQLVDCAGEVYDNPVQLELADGCPVRMSSATALGPEAIACLKERLEQLRWDCAQLLVCTRYAAMLT